MNVHGSKMAFTSLIFDFKGVKQDHCKVVTKLDACMFENGIMDSYSSGGNLRLYVILRLNSEFWGYVESENQVNIEVNGEMFDVAYYTASEAPEFMRQN